MEVFRNRTGMNSVRPQVILNSESEDNEIDCSDFIGNFDVVVEQPEEMINVQENQLD